MTSHSSAIHMGILEAIWQMLCARATFSLPFSALTHFQCPVTGEMNFWELPSFHFMSRCCAPSLALYEVLSLCSKPAALASAWGSLVHSPCWVWAQLPVRALGFFLCSHRGEENPHKHGWYSNRQLWEGSHTYLDISCWALQQRRGFWPKCLGIQGSFCKIYEISALSTGWQPLSLDIFPISSVLHPLSAIPTKWLSNVSLPKPSTFPPTWLGHNQTCQRNVSIGNPPGLDWW